MKKNIILLQVFLIITVLASALFFALTPSNSSVAEAAASITLNYSWQGNYNSTGEYKEYGGTQTTENLLQSFLIKEFTSEKRWGIEVNLNDTDSLTNYIANSNYKIGGYTVGSGLVFISNSDSNTISSSNIVWAKNIGLDSFYYTTIEELPVLNDGTYYIMVAYQFRNNINGRNVRVICSESFTVSSYDFFMCSSYNRSNDYQTNKDRYSRSYFNNSAIVVANLPKNDSSAGFIRQNNTNYKFSLVIKDYCLLNISNSELSKSNSISYFNCFGGSEKVLSYIYDTTEPTLSLPSPNSNGYYTGNINISVSDTNLDYIYVNSKIPCSSSSASINIASYLNQGQNTITVCDKAGNNSSTKINYDTLPPSLIFYSKSGASVSDSSTKYYFKENDSLKIYAEDTFVKSISINGSVLNNSSGQGSVLWNYPINTTNIPSIREGENTITVLDNVGLSKSLKFWYDTTPPASTITTANGSTISWGQSLNQYVSFAPFDSSSGLASAIIYNKSNPNISYDWLSYAVAGKLYYYTEEGSSTNNLFTDKKEAQSYVLKKRTAAIESYKSGYSSDFDSNLISLDMPYAAAGCAYYKYTNKAGKVVYSIRYETIISCVEDEYENWIGEFTGTKKLFDHDGEWKLTLIDTVGNSQDYFFNIDVTPPSLSVTKNSVTANTGTFYKTGDTISISSSDTNFSNIKINGITGSVTSTSLPSTALNIDSCSWLVVGENTIIAYDTYGNSTKLVFFFDNATPKITVLKNGTTSNGYFKKNDQIKLTATDANVESLTINGTIVKQSAGNITFTLNPSPDGQAWLVEGTNTIVLTDRAGNSTTTTFVYDVIAPTGTLSGVTNGGRTNSNVSFSWSDTTATATLNGTTYTKSASVQDNGSYTIVLTDLAGNSTSYTFTIDKTAPTGTLSGVTNGGITNGTVSFSWSETTATATLNGTTYTKETAIANEGMYSIILTDDVGNVTTYTFEIDKTAPTFSISGATDGQRVNSNVVLSWTEASATLKINGSTPSGINTSTSPITYTVNGAASSTTAYTAILSDVAGNTSTYTFTIDKTAPLIVMNKANGDSISFGQTSNQFVTFTISDDSSSISTIIINTTTGDTFDWTNYTLKNTTLYYYSPEGEGTSTVFASIVKAKSYVIEKRLATLNGQPLSGYAAEMDTNLNANDNGYAIIGCDYYAYQNKSGTTVYFIRYSSLYNYIEAEYESWVSSYISDKVLFENEGSFSITSTDIAGNETTRIFSIDTIAPTGTLSGVSDGGITNGPVSFSWTESGAVAQLNGNSYTKGATITEEGNHVIRLRDSVGNSTTYTFIIDKTAPTGTLSGVANGGRTNGTASLTWTEMNLTVTLDSAAYIKNTNVSTEGVHEFVLTDVAGNSSTYTFTIDKSVPEGTLSGVANGGITNTNVSFAWGATNYSATLDGNSYTKGATISTEGTHSIVLTNDVGTTKTYTFEIDKTAPTGTLSGVTNGGVTKDTVRFSWFGTNTCTDNSVSYTKNSDITSEGAHTIVLTDLAGNSTTYSFTIRTIPPVPVFSASATTTIDNTYYFNKAVSVGWEEYGVTATLNGATYEKNTAIGTEGEYALVLTDEPGNKTTVVLIIDTTAYSANYNKFVQNYLNHNNHWFETFVYQLSNNSYVRQSYWAFTNKTDALSFATLREQGIVERYSSYTIGTTPYCSWAARAVDGFDVTDQTSINGYPYAIYYDKNDSSKLIAYFNESNLQAAIIKYATESVSEKYIPSTPATAYPGDDTVSAQSLYRSYIFVNATSVAFTYKPTDITLTINNVSKQYADGLSLGINNIKEVDRAGNVFEYVVILDNEAPIVYAKDFAGNTLSSIQSQFVSQTTVYASEQFRLTIADEYDNQALLTVTFGDTTTNIIGGSYDLTASGTYTVKIRDLAGNNKTFTVYLSLEQPTITVTENLSTQQVLIGFTATINKVLDINTLMSISIYSWDSVAETWNNIVSDDESTAISISTLSYYFTTTHLYKIVVLDSYGRETTLEYNFIKDAPTGRVLTSSGLQLANGAETQLYCKFVWEDTTSLAYLNDLEYTKDVMISDEGNYTIRLVSTGGEVSIYTFKIDRTAPVGTLTGTNAAGFSNTSVSMTWSSATETTTVGYIKTSSDTDFYPYKKDTVISKDSAYTIKLIDGAGNSKEYYFEIKKTPPLVKIYTTNSKEILSAGLTNQSAYFTWAESGCTAIIKDSVTNKEVTYSKNTTLTQTATYSLYITDKYGNLAYYSFTIDKVAPVITATGVSEGESAVKTDVSFTWTESALTVTLNDAVYEKATPITIEGAYTFVALDVAGNVTTYTFEIDKTAPTGTLNYSGNLIANIYYSKNEPTFSWTGSGCSATLDGNPYSKNTKITGEGAHTIILTDRAGNSTTYSIVLDFVAPEGTIGGTYNFVNNQYYMKTTGAFTWEEPTATATLNGGAYTNGAEIAAEGQYSLVLSDRAGNSTTYTIVIDKTAPAVTFSTAYRQAEGTLYFKATFSATWTESGLTVMLNDDTYSKNSAVSTEGNYRLNVIDRAGNVNAILIVIDKTAPIGTFSKAYMLKNGTLYFNQLTAFTWTDNDCLATLDGVSYAKETVIDDIGNHILTLTDRAGNSTEYGIVIDLTAPVGTFNTVYNIYNDTYYFKSSTTFIWNESGCTATLDGNAYTKGQSISSEGAHSLVLFDTSNNSSTYLFEIDKTAPTLEALTPGNIANTIRYINTTEAYIWADEDVVSARLNDNDYIKGSSINDEGNYTLILTDRAGNQTAETVIIDKTAPLGTLSGTFYGEENYTSNNVRFSWAEDGCTATLDGVKYTKNAYINKTGTHTIVLTDLAGNSTNYSFIISTENPLGVLIGVTNGGKTSGTVSFSWTEPNYTCTLNEQSFTSGGEITSEGAHTLILTGPNNKTTTYTFEIDKTAPTGTLSGVSDGGITNGTVSFSWTESGAVAQLNSNSFTKGATISAEGTHTIILFDSVGNSTTYTFEIDKTAPTGTLSGVANGGRTNGTVSFSWAESDCTANVNENYYGKNTSIVDEGVYYLYLIDVAGNVTTYTFEIDKTAPTGTLSGVSDGGITNGTVSFSWSALKTTATLNGEVYVKDDKITADGDYIIIISDDVGNSTAYTFTIKKVAATGTLYGTENGGITKDDVSFLWYETTATATLNGEEYASGTTITLEGSYTLVLTDRAGNTSNYSFTIDKTAPVGALEGVTDAGATNTNVSFTWTETTATATLNGISYEKNTEIVADGVYFIDLTDFAGNVTTYVFEIDKTPPLFSYTGTIIYTNNDIHFFNGYLYIIWTESGCTATLNDAEYLSETAISNDGQYSFEIADALGNKKTFSFVIDKAVPLGTLTGVEQNGATNTDVSFAWAESGCSATINGEKYKNGTNIVKEGKYTIILTDDVGNSTTYTFEIDKTAPVGTLSGVTNGGRTNNNVKFNFSPDNNTTAILTIEIEGNSPAELESETTFEAEGIYNIIVFDNVGNSNTYTFTIDKTAPTGTLSGVTNGGITNGTVSFSWTESGCAATLDGGKYSKNSLITSEGAHTIIIENSLGTVASYSFTIDKTAPTGTLSGVTDAGATNTDVSFTWTETTATATLNGEQYASTTTISSEGAYAIVLTDLAGNCATLTFTIDKTAPVGEFNISHEERDGVWYFSGNVNLKWDEKATATINGEEYKKGGYISRDEEQTIIITDLAGNTTSYRIYIYSKAPTIKASYISSDGETKEITMTNGKSYNFSNLTISPEEGMTLYLNDIEVSADTILDVGENTLKIINQAGQESSITINIVQTIVEEESKTVDYILIIIAVALVLFLLFFTIKKTSKKGLQIKRI